MAGTMIKAEEAKEESSRYTVNDKLRDKLTDSPLPVDVKWGIRATIPVFTNFIMFTNDRDALIIPKNDRRLWVTGMFDKHKSQAYYSALYDWLETDGPSQLYWWLMRRPVAPDFIMQRAPMTPEKQHMIDGGRNEIDIGTEAMLAELKAANVAIASIDQMRRWVAELIDETIWPKSKEEGQLRKVLQKHGARKLPRVRIGTGRTYPWQLRPTAASAEPTPQVIKEQIERNEEMERLGLLFEPD